MTVLGHFPLTGGSGYLSLAIQLVVSQGISLPFAPHTGAC